MKFLFTTGSLSLFVSLLSLSTATATATTPSQQQGYRFLRRQDKDASVQKDLSRPRPRSLQDASSPTTPQVISFDGDLDRIVQLALERAGETLSPVAAMPSLAPAAVPAETEEEDSPLAAPTESPSLISIPNNDSNSNNNDNNAPTTSPVPSLPPVLEVNMCPGAILNRLVLVGWRYTIETAPTADPSQVIGEVEEILQESLIPIVLACNNALAEDASIVAIDSTLPRDSISVDAVCAPELSTSNVCTVVDGVIRIFLSDPGQNEQAQEIMKQAIEAVVNGPDFVDRVGTGLVKINILEEDTSSPAENDGNSRVPDPELDNSLETSNEGGFGTVSVVLLAVGGAALIAFVGAFYYWRHGNEGDGNATQMAGQSTMVDSETQPPPSPFSEMLPRAYKFNDSMSILTGQGDHMSPISERKEDSRSSGSPSVIMSEFSSDPDTISTSFDMGSSTVSGVPNTPLLVGQSPNLLGARKRAGGDDAANALDLNDSMSAIDSQLSIDTPLVTNTSAYNNNNNNKTLLVDTGDLKSVQEEEEAADNSLLFMSQLDAPQVDQPALIVSATDSEESAMTTGAASEQQEQDNIVVVQDGNGDDADNDNNNNNGSPDESASGSESDKGSELV